METEELVQCDSWEHVLALLPPGYEEAALKLGALSRRRQVRSAGDLLRLALVYSVCDLSLRLTAGWASAQGLAELSDVAVLKRLRSASDWLGWLVVRSLSERESLRGVPPWRVRILDASVVSEPGARGWPTGRRQNRPRATVERSTTAPSGRRGVRTHGAFVRRVS
jgi:hypothetical protein